MDTKHLAERAAEIVVTDLSIEHLVDETYVQSFCWALDNIVEYEAGMERFAAAVADIVLSESQSIVGAPDTTPDDGPQCSAAHYEGFVCTRKPDHTGSHAAGNGEIIVKAWEA